MTQLWGTSYTRSDLLARTGDLRQLADVQPYELSNGPERGVRAVRVRNAAGLNFSVLTDRGLGLYDLSFNGIPLPFMTPVGVTHPAFAEHAPWGWLRTWPAGFATPCGLTQVGSPVTDEGEELGIHGRASNLSARDVRWGADWHDEHYELWVEGTLAQTAALGENLIMQRRISTRLDTARVWITDRVENRAFQPVPLMLLQHFNLGFPLVSSATRLELPPHTTEPRDADARAGAAQYAEFSEPLAGYREQVFYHTLHTERAEVRLINPAFDGGRGLSVTLRYATADYPLLVQWKMMRAGAYVVGLEPANCHVEGRVAERERGTLHVLAPHESRAFQLEVEFAHTPGG